VHALEAHRLTGVQFANDAFSRPSLRTILCTFPVVTTLRGHRNIAQSAMIISGRVETADGTINVVAERIEALDLAATTRSRGFA
jgi:hypothetical protein